MLELLSLAGFVLIFKLVLGDGMNWRECTVGALRALGAGSVLPAGAPLDPAAAASSVAFGPSAPDAVGRSAIALVILTNIPEVLVLVVLGVALSLALVAVGLGFDPPLRGAPARTDSG